MRTVHKATSIAMAAALVLSVAACGGGDAKPVALPTKKAASASPTPTVSPTSSQSGRVKHIKPTADNPLGIDWTNQLKHPFTGPAADKFGAANVMDAFRHAVTFSLQEGYSDLIAKGEEARPVEFSFIKPYLTNAQQEQWDLDVKGALAKDMDAATNVHLFTMWHAEVGQAIYKFREGQQIFVIGRSFTAATTSVETVDGEEYLVMKFSVSRNIRFMKDGKAVLLPLKKDITYRMTPNGLPDIPWLIDDWDIYASPGPVTPDPLGATS